MEKETRETRVKRDRESGSRFTSCGCEEMETESGVQDRMGWHRKGGKGPSWATVPGSE
jgi:hypothetical protein